MIRGEMSVKEFVTVLWEHRIKVGLLFLALSFGPDLYDNWAKKRAAEQFEADRKSVDIDASFTGMMLVSAWTSCSKIGIFNNMEGCAKYQPRLLQEEAAPKLAKMAIEQRYSYYKGCLRFYAYEQCQQLLDRSFELSYAQRKNSYE